MKARINLNRTSRRMKRQKMKKGETTSDLCESYTLPSYPGQRELRKGRELEASQSLLNYQYSKASLSSPLLPYLSFLFFFFLESPHSIA